MQEPTERPATSAMYAIAASLASAAWDNAGLLRTDEPNSELEVYLYDWALVLVVIALDLFESHTELLLAKRFRAAAIVRRSLIDYAIRLRYYIVQAIKPMTAYAEKPSIPLDKIKQQIHAVNDWDQSDASLISKGAEYDHEFWPDSLKVAFEQYLANPTDPTQRNTPAMAYYLINNEPKMRGMYAPAAEHLLMRYRAAVAAWINQSIYVHGDQGVVTDVIEYKNNIKTGNIWRLQPFDFCSTHLLSAIDYLMHMNDSVAILRGGFAWGTQGAYLSAAKLWGESWKI